MPAGTAHHLSDEEQRFGDVIERLPDGRTQLNLDRFHDTEPTETV